MKHIHITIRILFMVTILCIGCQDNLDLVSQDSITDATFWKTAADFKLAANNLYYGLNGFGEEDTESDIAFNNPNGVSNGSYQPSETSDQWNDSYSYIRSANKILEQGATFEDADTKRYVAEAKFFRAWYYWRLMRIYGGVPLITKVLNTNETALFSPRSSRTEIADFILKDLAEAKADLPQQADLSGDDLGRITQGAALSLAARVALFEGTWAKFHNDGNAAKYLDLAITASAEVINSGQYSLYTGSGAQSYRYLFIEAGDDSHEVILDRRYARNIFGHDAPYMYDADGYNPTRKLADMYLDENGLPISNPASVFHGYATFDSEFADRDPRMTMTMIVPGTLTNRVFWPITKVANWPDAPQRNFNTGYILYKYMSEDPIANNSGRNGDNSFFDFDRHLIRYAEVLLIYAEATFEKNEAIADADLDQSINLLRDRVNMPHLTNGFVGANGLNMREEIRRERTIELALEGSRYDDLRRWKIAETELPQDIKGIKIVGTDWQTRTPYNDPIYQSKVDANGFLISESGRAFNPLKHYWQPLPTKEVAFYLSSGYVLQQNVGW